MVSAPWPGRSSCAPEPDPATTADILSQTVADLCGTGGTRGTGGIQELRRQLAQARTINEELRTLIEELRQQIATEALRRVEQENLLQQTLRAIQTDSRWYDSFQRDHLWLAATTGAPVDRA